MALTVLHLAGSPTSEFYADLSLLYASQCWAAVRQDPRYEHVAAWVHPDGTWCFPTDLTRESIQQATSLSVADAVASLSARSIDVAVPQLFCLAGMTDYRALLSLLGVRFVGNTAAAMALGADKAQASAVVAARGVAVPVSQVIRLSDTRVLGLPLVVKPVAADNSAGLTLVRTDAEWEAAVAAATAADCAGRALAETYIELGREVRCGVVDLGDGPVCLPLEEYAVSSAAKPIRDAADKLRRDEDGELNLVAKDASYAWIVAADDPVVPRVHAAALAAYEALGCRHYGLFDFRIDPEGEPYFLEAGLYCSYAPSSVITVMAQAAGIELEALFDHGVGAALNSVQEL